jgi:hypothetical protein
MPEDLQLQFPTSVAYALRWDCLFWKAGFEADDIIATLMGSPRVWDWLAWLSSDRICFSW